MMDRQAPPAAEQPMHGFIGMERESRRFRIDVTVAGDQPGIRVIDRQNQAVLMEWHGKVAKQLIRLRHLASAAVGKAPCFCGKNDVRHLALAAAGVSMAVHACPEPAAPLTDTATDARRTLPPRHKSITDLLLSRRGYHFAHDELLCLLLIDNPATDAACIERTLTDLVAWQIIQRIEVDSAGTFYDVNTRPHLHVYDRKSRTLVDAPDEGCLVI